MRSAPLLLRTYFFKLERNPSTGYYDPVTLDPWADFERPFNEQDGVLPMTAEDAAGAYLGNFGQFLKLKRFGKRFNFGEFLTACINMT